MKLNLDVYCNDPFDRGPHKGPPQVNLQQTEEILESPEDMKLGDIIQRAHTDARSSDVLRSGVRMVVQLNEGTYQFMATENLPGFDIRPEQTKAYGETFNELQALMVRDNHFQGRDYELNESPRRQRFTEPYDYWRKAINFQSETGAKVFFRRDSNSRLYTPNTEKPDRIRLIGTSGDHDKFKKDFRVKQVAIEPANPKAGIGDYRDRVYKALQ